MLSIVFLRPWFLGLVAPLLVGLIIYYRKRKFDSYFCQDCNYSFHSPKLKVNLKEIDDMIIDNGFKILKKISGNVYLVIKGTNLFARKDLSGLSVKTRTELLEGAVNWFKLEHPNIVKIIEMNKDDQYILMEYLEGGSVRTLLNEQSVLDWRKAIDIVVSVAKALEYSHSRKPPVVHRDIKPENILFDVDGTVKVSDWGLSTTPGQGLSIAGTLGYMAPETVQGTYSEKSDVFSLGAFLYELITGEPPIVYDLMDSPTIDLSSLDCPEKVIQTLIQMIHPNPDSRPTINVVKVRLSVLLDN